MVELRGDVLSDMVQTQLSTLTESKSYLELQNFSADQVDGFHVHTTTALDSILRIEVN